MRQSDDLPIEPLSEAAFARVETAVFSELDSTRGAPLPVTRRRSRRLTLALVAAAALPLGAALALVWREVDDARRTDPDRAALVSTRVVANDASTDTVLGDVSIHLERGASLVAVRDGTSGSLVVLETGVASFAVPPRALRPFKVQAGDVMVEVVGTRFQVSRNQAAVGVHTTEGVVRVSSGSRTVFLPAGASFDSTDSAPQLAPPGLSAAEPASNTAVADVAADAAIETDAAARSAQAYPTAPSSGDPRARFEQASRLEVSDPTESLRIYASMVARGGRWGEAAQYAEARLELEQGHARRAERLLQRYLREHPQGQNASDVRSLLAGFASQTGGAE